MGLVDGVANGFAQLMGRNEVTERTTVTLEDISKRKTWWINAEGDKINIDPERMVMIQDGKELTIVEFEAPRKTLAEGGYTLTSLPPEERVAPVAEVETTTPGAQVVDLATVRVITGSEPVPTELEQKNRLIAENERISVETEERKKNIFKKLTELAGELGKKKKYPSVRASGNRLLEEATAVYQQSLTVRKGQGSKELTSEYVDQYRACLESLQKIDAQVDTLVADFETTKSAGATADPVEMGNAAGAHDNLKVLLQAKANAPIGEDTVPSVVDVVKGKGGNEAKGKKTAKLLEKDESGAGDASGTDGGGPEGPKEGFETLLKARQDKIVALIGAITTPQSFAEFRRTLRKVETKIPQGGVDVKWYFINQGTLAKELSEQEGLSEPRELKDAEKKQVYIAEDFLRFNLNKKFLELKDADVANFYNQEQAKIIATQSETDLDAVGTSWPKQLEDIATWKGLLDTLTEVEKNKINDGYDEAIGTLRQNIEIRRRELQMAPAYQALDAFVGGRPGGGETIALLQDIIREAYRVFSEKVTKESQGKISEEECEELWRQKNGEQKLQEFVVNHLHVIAGVEPAEGEKIFRAIIAELQEGR
ncbi:MAG: hypothetical protein KBD27_00400 [Candidatus Moranbacteria bacterium]|nr:hypothetical protein [Candidatus Moranbacteria bacterium]